MDDGAGPHRRGDARGTVRGRDSGDGDLRQGNGPAAGHPGRDVPGGARDFRHAAPVHRGDRARRWRARAEVPGRDHPPAAGRPRGQLLLSVRSSARCPWPAPAPTAPRSTPPGCGTRSRTRWKGCRTTRRCWPTSSPDETDTFTSAELDAAGLGPGRRHPAAPGVRLPRRDPALGRRPTRPRAALPAAEPRPAPWARRRPAAAHRGRGERHRLGPQRRRPAPRARGPDVRGGRARRPRRRHVPGLPRPHPTVRCPPTPSASYCTCPTGTSAPWRRPRWSRARPRRPSLQPPVDDSLLTAHATRPWTWEGLDDATYADQPKFDAATDIHALTDPDGYAYDLIAPQAGDGNQFYSAIAIALGADPAARPRIRRSSTT